MKSDVIMFVGSAPRISFGRTLVEKPKIVPDEPVSFYAIPQAPVIECGNIRTKKAARWLAARMNNKPLTIKGTRSDGTAVRFRFTRVRAIAVGRTVKAFALENRRHTYGTCTAK